MTITQLSLMLVTAAGFAGPLFAQDLTQIPPPTPPLVAPVPERADWTVTLQYPPAPARVAPPTPGTSVQPAQRTAEVHSTKSGNLKRDRITATDGTFEDHWYAGSLYLWPYPGGKVYISDMNDAPSDPGNPEPSVASGFPGVAWLRLECYDKVESFEQRPCYHYVMQGVAMEAWIDVQTRFPLAYKCGDVVYQFKFNPPPAGPLALPPAYQEALDSAQKAIDHRDQLAKDLQRK